MADDSPDRDPEIRRRAAWLLAMLALVAGLFVLLIVTFFDTSGGDSDNKNVSLPSDTQVAPTTSSSSSRPARTSTPPPRATPTSDDPSTAPSSGSGGAVSCPSKEPCALDSDLGNAVSAINAYRTKNGKPAVPGSVSDAAKKCAVSNGSDCSGGWAETQVPSKNGRPDGAAAVEKIKQLGKLLGDMKSVEVGWAYDPGAKQFYFATVRQT